jgi:hypothetical protein
MAAQSSRASYSGELESAFESRGFGSAAYFGAYDPAITPERRID